MKLFKSIICIFLLICILGIVYAYINVDQVIEYRDSKNSNKNITLNEIIIPDEDNKNNNEDNSINEVTINNKIENKNLNIIENKTVNKVDVDEPTLVSLMVNKVEENFIENKIENNIENKLENKVENKTSDKIKKMLDGKKKENKSL